MSPSTSSPPRPRCGTPRPPRARSEPRPLARYTQADGLPREIITIPATAGSTLIVDRLVGGLGDSRLLAHLAADEPAENSQLICAMYLAGATRPACRRATDRDLHTTPFAADPAKPPAEIVHDDAGHTYRIRAVEDRPLQLRWTRASRAECSGQGQVVSLRDLVGTLQSYDPVLSITRHAIAARPARTSTTRLAGELRLLERSPTVLNRGLREAVLHAVKHDQVSMSEIAVRCVRVKQDRAGRISGDTSWLARRIGLRPDSSTGRLSPWVHTDVLAMIARQGLGLAPVEVEVA